MKPRTDTVGSHQPYHPTAAGFRIGQRVRFASEAPEHEPQGTITDVGYGALTITWDDEHSPSCVERSRWRMLEVI